MRPPCRPPRVVPMKSPRVDVAGIRRGQIVEAAVSIIAAQGLDKLSLSKIEEKVRMSRGQLTYYFKAKEDILLAVFDRLLEMIHQRVQAGGACSNLPPGWERLRHLLSMIILQQS